MHTTYLLLGTNLGEKTPNLHQAMTRIKAQIGIVAQASSIYETMPWGIEDQPIFYNQVLKVNTSLGIENLLKTTQGIEQAMGRQKYRRWGERLIDIDILYYNNTIFESEILVIPHAQIANRRFTLVPLVEIAPELVHPQLKLTQSQLLDKCEDVLPVSKVNVD